MNHLAQIGGVFIYSENPQHLADWYAQHLGIVYEVAPDGSAYYASLPYLTLDEGKKAYFAWSVIKSKKRPPVEFKPYMINYRVVDMEGLVQKLRNAGVEVKDIEVYNEGKFTWLHDPEGNQLELWEDTSL
ncbi:MAG: VOC family protein [Cytophagales bacterium]|nr:MAG: VOC family protein [Cytophagales bacterium]TAF59484.1 MAG: VOC family protein [Cytophagales bacterium]